EKRDFADAAIHKFLRLFDDLLDRPGYFRAAGIGNHAERAELVAAFLDRQESRDAARADLALLRNRQVLELVFQRIFRIDDPLALFGAAQRIGQTMIGLRADDDIDGWRAAQDFLTFGLGN